MSEFPHPEKQNPSRELKASLYAEFSGLPEFQDTKPSQAERYQMLLTLAFADQLTGLPNRHAQEAHYDFLIARKLPIGIIMYDVKSFSEVNNRLGYNGGDLMIQHTARYIAHQVRQDSAKDLVGRRGGDEFIQIINLNAIRSERPDELDHATILKSICNRTRHGYTAHEPIALYNNRKDVKETNEEIDLWTGYAIHEAGMSLEDLTQEANIVKQRTISQQPPKLPHFALQSLDKAMYPPSQ